MKVRFAHLSRRMTTCLNLNRCGRKAFCSSTTGHRAAFGIPAGTRTEMSACATMSACFTTRKPRAHARGFRLSDLLLLHSREREDVTAAAEVDENELISRRVRRDCEVVCLATQDEFQDCRTANYRELDRLPPHTQNLAPRAARGCGGV